MQYYTDHESYVALVASLLTYRVLCFVTKTSSIPAYRIERERRDACSFVESFGG